MSDEPSGARRQEGNAAGGVVLSPLPGPPRMRRALDAMPPASGAVVMGSSIVSIDLQLDHQAVLSAIMLWFAAVVWLILALMLVLRLLYETSRFAREASSPAALTGVAGTAVLGARLAMEGHAAAAAALLAVAALSWALLVGPVLRHWQTPTTGVSFVLTVATQGLAVLGATLAVTCHASWLLIAALAALILGVVFYVFIAARFDLRQLVTGHGDHWVSGGALAISTLACGKITVAASALGQFTAGERAALSAGTLTLWCLAMLWLGPLVVAEVWTPRMSYDVRRWATIFPLGMYAACSFTTGQTSAITGISDFAHVWTWFAFTISLLVAAGLIRHSLLLLLGQNRPADEEHPAETPPTQRKSPRTPPPPAAVSSKQHTRPLGPAGEHVPRPAAQRPGRSLAARRPGRRRCES